MLSIIFGYIEEDMKEFDKFIYNPSIYFENQYEDDWITNELSKKIIKDIDKSIVKSAKLIESPVLGPIGPQNLSGGTKVLILIANDNNHIFNATTCGENCAKWLLKIAENKNVTINLRYLMDFGDGKFKIKIKNNGKIVHNMKELIINANEYV